MSETTSDFVVFVLLVALIVVVRDTYGAPALAALAVFAASLGLLVVASLFCRRQAARQLARHNRR